MGNFGGIRVGFELTTQCFNNCALWAPEGTLPINDKERERGGRSGKDGAAAVEAANQYSSNAMVRIPTFVDN